MSSAQIHVRKSQNKNNHTCRTKTITRADISKKHTQQRENTSKRHENKLNGTKLRAHVICANTRRKIAEQKQAHVQTYPKNTHNKGKTHPKGMKTHGFRPVSDLFGVFMFSVLPSISTTKYYSGTRAYMGI